MHTYRDFKLRGKILSVIILIALLFAIPYIVAFIGVSNHMANPVALISFLRILMPVMAVVLIVICALAIFLGIRFSKRVLTPITKISNAARDLAVGKLDLHIDYESNDELGVMVQDINTFCDIQTTTVNDVGRLLNALADGDLTVTIKDVWPGEWMKLNLAFKNILSTLNRLFNKINDASDQTASGSDQVASASQALAQGATEQASSIEQLSATVMEISEHVKSNAANATNADNASNAAKDKLTEADTNMKEMMKAMSEISEGSKKIGNIIKTIDNIAFQTNILALNAAVEAARAGTAGKGFAVVADEVRNLASKSAEAAKDTTTLIGDSIKAVENGSRIAGLTENALVEVMTSSGSINELINTIAKATNQQATSIGQINQGVQQISTVVQTNSATAEQSAAASEELAAQAKELKRSLAGVKLKGMAASKAPRTSSKEKPEENQKKAPAKIPPKVSAKPASKPIPQVSSDKPDKKPVVLASSPSVDNKYV